MKSSFKLMAIRSSFVLFSFINASDPDPASPSGEIYSVEDLYRYSLFYVPDGVKAVVCQTVKLPGDITPRTSHKPPFEKEIAHSGPLNEGEKYNAVLAARASFYMNALTKEARRNPQVIKALETEARALRDALDKLLGPKT